MHVHGPITAVVQPLVHCKEMRPVGKGFFLVVNEDKPSLHDGYRDAICSAEEEIEMRVQESSRVKQ